MNRRRKSSLLWGLVGALLFLVLAFGYRLAGGTLPVGFGGLAGIALGVGVVVTAVGTVLARRLPR